MSGEDLGYLIGRWVGYIALAIGFCWAGSKFNAWKHEQEREAQRRRERIAAEKAARKTPPP